jgi:hypothetical protein
MFWTKTVPKSLLEQFVAGQNISAPLVDFVEIVFVAILVMVLVGERDHHELLLSKVAADTEAELRLAVSLLVALPLAGGVLLLNLLLNAIQVLGGHGQVTLAAEREDGQLLLRVEDAGPGFPEEMLRAGVRPFATGWAGGTGLGLAMVRRFARDHDGELELANREPRGARVTLRLPCSATGAGTGENQSHGCLSISRANRPAGVGRLGAMRRRQAGPGARASRAPTSAVRRSERAHLGPGPWRAEVSVRSAREGSAQMPQNSVWAQSVPSGTA